MPFDQQDRDDRRGHYGAQQRDVPVRPLALGPHDHAGRERRAGEDPDGQRRDAVKPGDRVAQRPERAGPAEQGQPRQGQVGRQGQHGERHRGGQEQPQPPPHGPRGEHREQQCQ